MTVREALAAAADLLRKTCIDEPLREARLLLSLQPRFTLTYQLGHPNEALSREEVRLFDVQTTRRAAGEPFAYIAVSNRHLRAHETKAKLVRSVPAF